MKKELWEEDAIERFRLFLSRTRGNAYGITARDVVIDPDTKENFDYQLTGQSGDKVAVELFRLLENGNEIAKAKVWNEVVTLLREELTRRNIKGYLVRLPALHIPRRDAQTYLKRPPFQPDTVA